MKTFKKECKHAEFLRETKWLYNEEEKEDGCWVCGGTLVRDKTPPQAITADSICISDKKLKAELESNPGRMAEYLKHINEECKDVKYYVCVPCHKKHTEKIRNLPIEEYLTVEQVVERMDSDRWTLIKEVELCGPDCPHYDSLAIWKAEYNEDGTPKNGKTAKEMYEEIRRDNETI